jgi:hypothetical protein
MPGKGDLKLTTKETHSGQRKKGRPKGSKNKPKVAPTNLSSSLEVIRRRGRPKGSNNKKTD